MRLRRKGQVILTFFFVYVLAQCFSSRGDFANGQFLKKSFYVIVLFCMSLFVSMTLFCFALEHLWRTQHFLSLQADCGVASPQPHSPSLHLSYLKKPKMTSISHCCKAVVPTWTAHLAYSFQSSPMSCQTFWWCPVSYTAVCTRVFYGCWDDIVNW